ncbi:MAG: uracil-xanthine permease family protein [Treponema sp.]|nr:uracil-xanthine permease family protein [Treponema sp.]
MTIFEKYQDDLTPGKKVVLGVQHTFTMFGATILVPILTGLDISVALFMAGVCTLWFHLATQGKVPIFLGSSFAFIAPIVAVSSMYGMEYAQGGIVISGLVYLLIALLVYALGVKRVMSLFPPIITGPIVIIIGLMLAPVAISSAQENWWIALVSFLTVAIISIFTKGFIKLLPVICGLIAGYIVAVITGNVDFTAVREAAWIGIPKFTIAKFNVNAILIIAPVAIATVVEHLGDMNSIKALTGRDPFQSPGVHRTLLGDGIASSISAMFGGPANTTYSENSGVMALTKVYNPIVMRIAACFAILLSVFPKLSAVISTIPGSVIGGISIVLFGMIASVGARNLVENKVDFKQPRNLFIFAVIMVLALGGAQPAWVINETLTLSLSPLALAAIVGIVLNKILPEKKEDQTSA